MTHPSHINKPIASQVFVFLFAILWSLKSIAIKEGKDNSTNFDVQTRIAWIARYSSKYEIAYGRVYARSFKWWQVIDLGIIATNQCLSKSFQYTEIKLTSLNIFLVGTEEKESLNILYDLHRNVFNPVWKFGRADVSIVGVSTVSAIKIRIFVTLNKFPNGTLAIKLLN